MRSDRLKVAVTRRLPKVVERRMDELFDVELRSNDAPMTRPELVETVKRVDILVPCIVDTIDTALLAQAGPQLKLIANFGAGFDNIDVRTALRRGILVSNTPGVVTDEKEEQSEEQSEKEEQSPGTDE